MKNEKLVLAKYDKSKSQNIARFSKANKLTCYQADVSLDGTDDAVAEIKELLTFIATRHGNDQVFVVVEGKGARALLRDKRFKYRTFKDNYNKNVEGVIIQAHDAVEYVREFYRATIEILEGVVVTVEFKYKTPSATVKESNKKAKETSTLLTDIDLVYSQVEVSNVEIIEAVFSYFKEMVEDSELNIALPNNHPISSNYLAKYYKCDLTKFYQPYVNVKGHYKHEAITKLFVVDLTTFVPSEFNVIDFHDQFNFNETLDRTRQDYNESMKQKAHRAYHRSNIYTDRFTNLSFEDKILIKDEDIKDAILMKVLQIEYVEDLDYDEVPNDLKSVLVYLDADYVEPSLATEFHLTLEECIHKILKDKTAVKSINKGTSRRMLIPIEGNINFTDDFEYLQKRYYSTRFGMKQYIFVELDLIN